MSDKHLICSPKSAFIRGSFNVSEEKLGLWIKYNDPQTITTNVILPWEYIREALKRKDKR